MLMSPEQIGRFLRDGYLVCPDVVGEDLLGRLKDRAAQIVDAFDPDQVRSVFSARDGDQHADQYFLESGQAIRCFLEQEALGPDGQLTVPKAQAINKIGHALHDRDEAFQELSEVAGFVSMARQLGLARPREIQSMYIFKPPRIGGEVCWHQDATFLYTDPVTVIGFWIALDDATIENGCLWAVPGGHRSELKRRYFRTFDERLADFEELSDTPFETASETPLEVSAGSLVLLHGLLPHASKPNRSGLTREAYSVHVIDGDAHYPADNWLSLA